MDLVSAFKVAVVITMGLGGVATINWSELRSLRPIAGAHTHADVGKAIALGAARANTEFYTVMAIAGGLVTGVLGLWALMAAA